MPFFFCACASNNNGFNSSTIKKYSAFEPAKQWLDNNGRHINAHGAGFIFDNGKYYMFGEHKLGGTLGNKALVGVHCYSSDDLYNWRDEGIALEMSKDPESEIIMGTVLERPKVIYNEKTKKYVMLFHLEARKGNTRKSINIDDIFDEKPSYSAAKIGFAISDKITGPYKYVHSMRPNAGKLAINDAEKLKETKKLLDSKYPNWQTAKLPSARKQFIDGHVFWQHFEDGQQSRDMTAFVDDDKKAYVFCASENNSTLHIHELTDDYLNFTGKFVRVLKMGYHEAPAIFKTKGKYYMFSSYCTGWTPNPGRISVANSIMDEWKELGNPCRGEGQKPTKTQPVPAKADTTFRSQSTYVIPIQGKTDAFIYFGDRWRPNDAIDGRYIPLPVEWENDMPIIKWYDKWDLSIFDKK